MVDVNKLMDEIKNLLTESKDILVKAKTKKHYRTALAAINETRKSLEFICKLFASAPPPEPEPEPNPFNPKNLTDDELITLVALVDKGRGIIDVEVLPEPTPQKRPRFRRGDTTDPMDRTPAEKPVTEPKTDTVVDETGEPEPNKKRRPWRPPINQVHFEHSGLFTKRLFGKR